MQRLGQKVWIDEAEMKAGDFIKEKIKNSINKCDYVLVFVSNNSIKSDWVKREIEYIENENEYKIIFIFIEKINFSDVNTNLQRTINNSLHIDFSEEDKFELEYQKLLEAIEIKKKKIDINNLENLTYVEDIFQNKNWGWYPIINKNFEIIHFSYSGYYKCINDIKIMDIKPKIMEQNYVNYLSIKSNNLIPNSSDFIVSVIKNFLR